MQRLTVLSSLLVALALGCGEARAAEFRATSAAQLATALHQAGVHTLVAHNTFVDIAGVDLLLGNAYKSGWPRAQRVLLPERNQISDNVFRKTRGGVAIDRPPQDKTAPLDRFTFAANEFSGNVVLGGTVALSPVPDGITVLKAAAPPAAPPAGAIALHRLTPEEVGPAWLRGRSTAGESTPPR